MIPYSQSSRPGRHGAKASEPCALIRQPVAAVVDRYEGKCRCSHQARRDSAMITLHPLHRTFLASGLRLSTRSAVASAEVSDRSPKNHPSPHPHSPIMHSRRDGVLPSFMNNTAPTDPDVAANP